MNFATFIAFIKPSAALMTTTRTTEEQYRGRYSWPLHLVHQRRGRVGAILSVAVLNVSSDSQQTSAVYQLHVTSYTVAWHKSARQLHRRQTYCCSSLTRDYYKLSLLSRG